MNGINRPSHRSFLSATPRRTPLAGVAAWLAALLAPLTVIAQGTAFTYQGRLTDGPGPATGLYDLRFTLFDAVSNGTAIAGPLTNISTAVNAGLFTVTLDFGPGVFTGPPRWLEIGARTNGNGAFGTILSRQQLAAAPYAVFANTASNLNGTLPANRLTGTLPPSVLSGTYSNALNFTNPANGFAGDGGRLTNVDAHTLGGQPADYYWQLGGNYLAGSGGYFGSADNSPLELSVNGLRALRLEPTTNGAPNVIGGAPVNQVDPGVQGAFIGGGGVLNFPYVGGTFSVTNRVSADFAVIGGGDDNWIEAGSSGAAIVGGNANRIAASTEAAIGGGFQNMIETGAWYSVISGGDNNLILGASGASIGGGYNQIIGLGGDGGVIAGGNQNVISNGFYSVIPGGEMNRVTGDHSLAAGFRAKALHPGTFVWADTTAADFASSTSNLFLIRASSGVGIGTTAPEAPLHVAKGSAGAVTADTNSIAVFEKSGSKGFVSVLGPASSEVGLLFGNPDNNADGGVTFNDSLVPHGLEFRTGTNVIQMSILANGNVGIGTIAPNRTLHLASTGDTELGIQSADGGGHLWTLQSSGVTGLSRDGSFQIIDRTPGFNVDRFQISTNGNIGIGTSTPNEKLDVAGNIIASGSICANNGVNCASDRNAKENFTPVNSREILEKVAQLPVSHWNYKTDPQTPHLGPMAQDFHAAFGVGSDERHIAVVDEGGVALAAIQGLNQKLEASQAEVEQLKEEVGSLRKLVQELSHDRTGGSR